MSEDNKNAWSGKCSVTTQPLHQDGENLLSSTPTHSEAIRQLADERDALAAQVEALRKRLCWMENRRDELEAHLDKVTDKVNLAIIRQSLPEMHEAGGILDEESKQHLRELRAEAGRAGWVACVDWLVENSSANLFTDGEAEQARDIGDQYADSIKQGK